MGFEKEAVIIIGE